MAQNLWNAHVRVAAFQPLDIPIFISRCLLSSARKSQRAQLRRREWFAISRETGPGGVESGKITGGNNAIDWAGELARALREMDDISPGRPLQGTIR